MTPKMLLRWGGCIALMTLPAASPGAAAPPPASDASLIQNALSAGPKAIAEGAKVVTMGATGMRELRPGTNGFTCMPDDPSTPGVDPMCLDRNAMRWAGAWMSKQTPPADAVGVIYMLAGGTDASNTDPYAKPPADGKWVVTGPHLMLVGSPALNAQYPSGANPDTTKPYVMWGGTPYAHVMIPVR
ncbi:hypothetical protein M8312_14195 [Sphingomonas sp. KRR8]|uniref:hypothetical protein n=1 Tax=Sphingomonas sp. KRR8 TaxID=2942996 RepID=UPI0020217888|nr:hypothetical protein [Sphingomonas sp. KRR8]URD60908.1 hypothetical protein M8312_14195 [Sphingomonas sp. KRR8]